MEPAAEKAIAQQWPPQSAAAGGRPPSGPELHIALVIATLSLARCPGGGNKAELFSLHKIW